MRALFTEIRQGNVAAVAVRLDTAPELVDAVAKAPPKKDDGQSTLQVAIRSANFAIAELLLDRGADVHFIDRSSVNGWNIPVLHDAIRAATFSTRWTVDGALPGEPPRLELMSTAERFERAFHVLGRILDAGADPNVLDSAGNPALMRAALDALQVIHPPVQDDLAQDLERIFRVLSAHGAEASWEDLRYRTIVASRFAADPVARFLS